MLNLFDNYMMSNDIKSFILENDKESTSNQNSVKKNITCLKIWNLFVIFLQNEASWNVIHRDLL